MSLALSDLLAAQTSDQVLENFLSELETLGIPARSWRKGGAYRTILRVVAGTYAGFTQVMAAFVSSGFLEYAKGGWLTLLARNVFQVERPSATFATGSETFTNGGGIFDFAPGEVTIKNPITGATYVNDETFHLDPGDVLAVAIRAVNSGSASTSAPGEITALVTTLPGVTITNPDAVVGTDAQSDPDLRQACRNRLAAISVRGPRGAYASAVLGALRTDGTTVNINRVQISPGSSTGVVDIYMASPSGAPLSSDIDFAVANIELTARPDSVTVNPHAATPVDITRTIVIWAKRTDGVSASDILADAQAALIEQIAVYPIGGIPKPPLTQGYLYQSAIEGICKSADPSVYAVDGAGPDVALSPGQVAVLAATLSVRVVDVGSA